MTASLPPTQPDEKTDPPAIVATAEAIAPTTDDGPRPVIPEGKVATDMSEPIEPKAPEAVEQPAPQPESPERLPALMANIPSAVHAVPHDELQPAEAIREASPSGSAASTPKIAPVPPIVDDSWREPVALLDSLKELAAAKPTSQWATDVTRQIRALGPAVAAGSNESVAILGRLTELDRQAPELAKRLREQHRELAHRLGQTGFALARRLDVWQEIVRLGEPQSADAMLPKVDPERLALCLAEIDAVTGDSAEGRAWRDYLLVDVLKESSKRHPSPEDAAARQVARQALARLTQAPLTPHQQKFVTSAPVAALRAELRRWAAEPIGTATLLRDLEAYEHSGLPSDARQLALDCQYLAMVPAEARRQLADSVDMHYRNANLRVAVTEELLNKLIPERNLEYAPVRETVLGRKVWGESLMASEVAVRMQPDPKRVRMALEVKGEIAAMTTADAGPARFHNDSESSYVARKPLEIDMDAIHLWGTEVDVYNETRIRSVETPLDGVPLFGSWAKGLAKSQAEQSKPAITEEVKQKIAAQARERLDTEARERFAEVVKRMNERVFDPLNNLSLDPQMIEAQTTEKRFAMRLRVAGEDQLGGHTARPLAPADSLASVQLHESVINNGIQRLLLNGRTFTLPELSQHVASRLNRPAAWEVDPEQADVKITFADKDAVVVRCQNERLMVTLAIAQLGKGPHKWKNFQVRAFFKPEVRGRSAQLVRDGVIQLPGQHGAQLALRGIFSHAFSSNRPWELVPEQIVNEKRLGEAAITQFVIDDGWIGLALGPKPVASTAARRQRWGM